MLTYFIETGLLLFLMLLVTYLAGCIIGSSLRPVFGRRPLLDPLQVIGARLAGAQEANEKLGQVIDSLARNLRIRLDGIENNITRLSDGVSQARHKTRDIEKRVDNLKTTTEVAATMVDTIQHRLDADVRELKRIEDQVKSSIISRVDNGARHIDYLEREVLGLEREVFVH